MNNNELTAEDVKEFNLTEFKLKHTQLEGSYNTLVLSSLKDGTSFKPFPSTDFEKELLLWDMAECLFDGDIDQAVRLYEKPDFCFCYAPQQSPAYIVRSIIKEGGFLPEHESHTTKENGRPHCPYA